MKNIDSVGSGYNNPKSYSYERLLRIADDIRTYKTVSEEDIVALSKACKDDPDQDKRLTYGAALKKYNDNPRKDLFDQAIKNLSAGVAILADEILNIILNELAENRPISEEIRLKLLELVTDNKYPKLTLKIISILYKIAQKQESYDDLVNLANKSAIRLTAEDNGLNRSILKIIEEAFTKTNLPVAEAVPYLLKLAIDKDCIYRMRDQALNLLTITVEYDQGLGDFSLLRQNLSLDNDPKLIEKSQKILELAEKSNTEKLILNQPKKHDDKLIVKVAEDQSADKFSKLNENIILLTKKIIGSEVEERIKALETLSRLIQGQSNLPQEITLDICSLALNESQAVSNRAIAILDKLVDQGAKVDLSLYQNLANKLLTEKITEDSENNIIDILVRNNEFAEFIDEFNYLKRQSNILLGSVSSANEEKQIAAKRLYEYGNDKPLPPITVEALKKGLRYSAAISFCLKALAAFEQKIEFLPVEIELITYSLNSLDQETAKAASNILVKSGIDHLPVLESSALIEDKQAAESNLKLRLGQYFPHLNVTYTIVQELRLKFGSLAWSDNFVDLLLAKLTIDDFSELARFLAFVKYHAVTKAEITDYLKDKTNLKNLERTIAKQRLGELVEAEFILSPDLFELKENIVKLIDHDQTLTEVSKLVTCIKLEDRALLLQGLKFINEYAIKDEVCSLFLSLPSNSWQSALDRIAFKTASAIDSIDKNQYVLLKELSALNQDNPKIKQLVDDGYLSKTIAEITRTYKQDSLIFPQGKPIINWRREEILTWAEGFKKACLLEEKYLPEIIAVINRVNYLDAGYEIRSVQLSAILTLLNSGDNGRLLQIATGEGKSTVTAALAAIHALRGKYVDVITSSPILAKRDSNDKVDFYRMLGLSCGDNTDKTITEGVKSCYKSNIVYGDVSSYQFDLLKSEYKRYGTRSDRTFEVAIVDEVDSMLIDEGGKIAKLSSPISGMEHLEPLLLAVWQHLALIRSKYSDVTGQLLWINGEFDDKTGELLLLGDTCEDDVHLVDDAEKFTAELLEEYINSLLQEQAVAIPNHLVEFSRDQAKYWAKSAVAAVFMEENRNYIIIDDEGSKKVAPVAYDSTGVTQEKTQWGDGLHQFLEIKHGLRIKPEGLTSCFISNTGYFRRYGNNIYGMSGTLGSSAAQKLLQSSYNLDLGFIPTYRTKNFRELAAIIAHGRNEWLQSITDNVIREGNSGRACLVISETIADSMDIEEQIKQGGFPSNKIINYYRSDNLSQAEFLANKLSSGTIIVATNLAGRGTDIKTTEELERNGGLHICLTFLPTNLRVEQQAFGRTSRQGNAGTGQLIIAIDYEIAKLQKAYPDCKRLEFIEQFKQVRDLAETDRIEDIIANKVPKLKLEDGLFDEFKQLAHQLVKREDNKYKLLQLEESWGLWFKKIAHENNYSFALEQQAKSDFTEFSNTMTELYGNNLITVNPAYLTRQAVADKMSGFGYVLEHAIDLFTKATHLDDKFSSAANYYLAFSVLKQTGSLDKANPEGAAKAAGYLIAARNQITDYIIPAWQSMQIMLDPSYNDSLLNNQLHNKIDLLHKQISSIDTALSVIENAASDQIVRIKNQTMLDSLYPSEEYPKEEILELNIAGLDRVYEIEAVDEPKEPKDWFTNLAVAILGIAQIVIGVAFTYVTAGLGAKLSSAMIAEGIKDIYNAVKATIKGESLNFDDYWADKGLSYAISIALIGVENIKNSATLARQTAVEGGKEAVKKTAIEITEKTLKDRLVDVGKQAVEFILIEEGGLALTRGISGALGNFRDATKKEAVTEIRRVLEQPHIIKALNEIIAVDRFSNDGANQKLLMQKIQAALIPHENQLYNLGKGLVSSLSNSIGSLKIVSTAMEVGGYAQAINEFNGMLEKFCLKLEDVIAEVHQQLPSTDQLMQKRLKVDDKTLKLFIDSLSQAGIINGARSFDENLVGKGFIPGIAVKTSNTSNSNKQNSEHKQIFDQDSREISLEEQTFGNKSKITNFQFPDLTQGQIGGCTLDKVDLGLNYSGSRKQVVIDCVRNLHVAYSGDYSAERERLIQNLGQSIGANMIRKLQSGFIQPASKIIASTGIKKIGTFLAEHNDRVRRELSVGRTKTITIDEKRVIVSRDNPPKIDENSSNGSLNQQNSERIITIDNIEKRLADQYPGLSSLEKQKLAIEVYNLEKQWRQDPLLRPGIQLADSGGITSDVPRFIIPIARSQAIGIVMNKYENSLPVLSARGGELIGVVDNSKLLNQSNLGSTALVVASAKSRIQARQDGHHDVNIDMDDVHLRLGERFFSELANESTGVKKNWALNTVEAIKQVRINRTESLPLRQDFINESNRNFSTGKTGRIGTVFDRAGNEIRWAEEFVGNVSAKNLPLTTVAVKGSFATAGQYLIQSAIDVFGEQRVQNAIDSISNTIDWQNMTEGQKTFTIYAAPYGITKVASVGGKLAISNAKPIWNKIITPPEVTSLRPPRNEVLNWLSNNHLEEINTNKLKTPTSKLNTGRSNQIIPYKINNELPRNLVQERLGGYYEGLSFEHIQLQRQAEDLLLRDKFGIKNQVVDYKSVIEKNTGITKSVHSQNIVTRVNLPAFTYPEYNLITTPSVVEFFDLKRVASINEIEKIVSKLPKSSIYENHGAQGAFAKNILDTFKESTNVKLVYGPAQKDIWSLNFHDFGRPLGRGERTLAYQTTLAEGQSYKEVKEMLQRLALKYPEWGERNAITVSKIDKGTWVAYLEGEAAKQEMLNPLIIGDEKIKELIGGGTQLKFRDFDIKWVREDSIPLPDIMKTPGSKKK